jgi:solute carrier family 25 citrate transporter 1
LYGGAGVFCASNAAKSGIRFLTFDSVKDRLPRDPETGKHTATSSMLAGIAAGVAESITVVTPGENLKTKMVEDRAGARRFNSAAAVVRGVVAKDGPAGLFRGVVPVTMKQGSNALVRFSSYHALLDAVQPVLERGGWGPFAPVVAGAGAGVVTVYATMPFDVVKTKMQSLEGREQYGGTWRCIMAVARQSGVGGFWRGTMPRLVRLSVSPSVFFYRIWCLSRRPRSFADDGLFSAMNTGLRCY